MYVRVNVYMYLCMIFFRSFEKTVIDVTKSLHPSNVLCVGASLRLRFLCRTTDFGGRRPRDRLVKFKPRHRPVRRRSARHPMVGHAQRLLSQPE